MKNLIALSCSILFAPFCFGQLGWVDQSVLTSNQKAAINYLSADASWAAQGTQLGELKLKYYDKSNDVSSVWLKRWVLLPSISIPALIGGELADDKRMSVQANPLVGLGFTFRSERISWENGKSKVSHGIAYQPMLLFYKYDLENNRFGLVYGFSVTIVDYIQIGYGRSDYNMPNYRGKDLLLIGASIPVAGLFPEGSRSGNSSNMKAVQ